jgi:hypothetical protein
MAVFGCSSIRGVCNADIGCGSKTLCCASVLSPKRTFNLSGTSNFDPLSTDEVVSEPL